jgi:hypothetical protein
MTNVYVLLRLFLSSSFTSFAVSRSLCLLMQSLLLLPQCAELCTFVQLLLARRSYLSPVCTAHIHPSTTRHIRSFSTCLLDMHSVL